MAKKPETVFKERIKPMLEALGGSWWVKTQMLSTLGIPDYLGCVQGAFIALELKKDRKSKPSKLQLWVLGKIMDAGGIAMVVYPENWDEVYGVLSACAAEGERPATSILN